MNLFELLLGPSLISATLRLTVPILFVAVGGCFGSKANVFNIGLESYLGISAFFAMCGSYWSQSPWVGLLLGMLAGLVMSCIFAVFVLYFESDTMVVGIGGYHFRDYVKAGLPLILVSFVICMVLLPILFPFYP